MKRIVYALLTLLVLVSCSVDDDTPNTSYELAEITENDLPDSFTFGENYTVTVDYTLPSSCNSFAGIDAVRAGTGSEQRRQIYVAAVSILNNSANCDETTPGSEGSGNFSITIDDTEPYTFYFWTGVDSNDQAVYTEVTVPVEESPVSQD